MAALLFHQIRALVLKNILLVLKRQFISTPLRAFVFPLLFAFLLANARTLFFPDATFGIGTPSPVRSLSSAAAAMSASSSSRDRVAFVNGGFAGGPIDRVIAAVAAPLADAGLQVRKLAAEAGLVAECGGGGSFSASSSRCLAAVVFRSSPSEGPAGAAGGGGGGGGAWNYTFKADGSLGLDIDVGSRSNDAQIYLLPLQRAIDLAIYRIETSGSGGDGGDGGNDDAVVLEFPFTARTDAERDADVRRQFADTISKTLAVAFFVCMFGVMYHLVGAMAAEREAGITQLLDTMMPNPAAWHRQAARLASHHLSFTLIYGPGWLAVGVVMGTQAFAKTSAVLPIITTLLAGLSLTSLSVMFGCLFKRAQLSGIVATIVGLIMAILAQVLGNSETVVVAILSLLFPPINYTFAIILMARWESAARPASVAASAPTGNSTVPLVAFWAFSLLQAVVYPLLGAFAERTLFGTGRRSRRTAASGAEVALRLDNVTKVYTPSKARRIMGSLTRRKPSSVRAVNGVSLEAFRGEILVLLGTNGSGKSTTLDAIAGQHSVSSGSISISYADGAGKFGYCPQRDVLWDDLTVSEHVRILDGVKCVGKRSTGYHMQSLIKACGLSAKSSTLAKNLSGGQKRKLQLALMFVGGSSVCCVDEASSGVDPLSRRRLWDILLAERGSRTLVLTTHFLDEADVLADRIEVLSHGSIVAAGTSAELKQKYGHGYRVHVNNDMLGGGGGRGGGGPERAAAYGDVLQTVLEKQTIYLPGTTASTLCFLERLERDGIREYDAMGPTLEDAFLNIARGPAGRNGAAAAREQHDATDHDVTDHDVTDHDVTDQSLRLRPHAARPARPPSPEYTGPNQEAQSPVVLELLDGKPTTMFFQARVLYLKRVLVVRRNFIPVLLAIAIPIIAAGCASFSLPDDPATCQPALGTAPGADTAGGISPEDLKIVVGPEDRLSEAALAQIAQFPPEAITMVESEDRFFAEIRENSAVLAPGGFFISDRPVFAWRAEVPMIFAHLVQNLLDNMLLNMTIASDYAALDIPFFQSEMSQLLVFATYFGLAIALYPAFLALYPAAERLKGISNMQFSNSVHALPLWGSYLAFDFSVILLVSGITLAIFAAVSGVWFQLGLVFLVLLLYGIASTLFSYVVALFAKSQLAAFALAAGIQAVMYLAFFITFMAISTKVDPAQQKSSFNIAYFTMGAVSPICNVARGLYLSLNLFGLSCRGHELAANAAALDMFGGPILYLILQSIIFFGILLWRDWASSATFGSRSKTVAIPVADQWGGIELESRSNVRYGEDDGLAVSQLYKRFKKTIAVNDVSFEVRRNECFALLGPNGAGKSTCISMIRGDIRPSSRKSQIFVDGISLLTDRAQARARLGVCPQTDPLDDMTVAEHLLFYARVRGVRDPAHNAGAVMEGLGLGPPLANRRASRLSGGNRRKLTLGIALVGNPAVLLLDEPSSGMDPASKRVMWRALAAVVPGRAVVLTTHSMEEADALASGAAIVAGRMLASGTTDQLRRRYAPGLFVHLVHARAPHTSPEETGAIMAWARRSFPRVRWERGMLHGQVRLEIEEMSLVEVFGRIENAKASLGLLYYSVNRATLDHVFLTVVGAHAEEHQ